MLEVNFRNSFRDALPEDQQTYKNGINFVRTIEQQISNIN